MSRKHVVRLCRDMRFRHSAALIVGACALNPHAIAQSEELLMNEYATGVIDTIEEFAYDTAPTFYITDWNIGSMGNAQQLSQVPPTSDLWAGSQFNMLAPAAETMNVLTYPARTAGHMFLYENGLRYNNCSANMVGRRHALVAAHCLYSYTGQYWFGDSMSFAPAYDNGDVPLSEVIASRAYIPLAFSNSGGWEDVALIELREPIGDEVGWIGLASTTDDSYFTNKVFHKFSYPGQPDPIDPSIIHNGDTLNYHYGFIDPNVVPFYLVVPGPEAHGVNGESGSSMLYTDNTEYYSLGVASFVSNYKHRRITPQCFHAYAQVIADNSNVGLGELSEDGPMSYVYPNPAVDRLVLVHEHPSFGNLAVEILDAQGRVVSHAAVSGRETVIDVSALEIGLYVYRLIEDGIMRATGRFLVEGN